jgi:hypothetical protein
MPAEKPKPKPPLDFLQAISRYARWAALVVSVLFMVFAVLLLTGVLSAPAGGDFATAGGAFAAGAAVLFAAWQYGDSNDYTRSKFALDTAMEFVERSYRIINVPPPATRVQWIHAGRVLARAMKMAKTIHVREHREAWEQFREEWRVKFSNFLRKSPEYYLGLEEPADFDPNRMAYLDDKLIDLLKQTNIKSRFAMQHRSGGGTSMSYLSTRSIKPMYDFAQYNDGWEDPLDDLENFTEEDRESLMRRDYKGLGLMIYALKKWQVFGSKVIETAKINAGDWKPEDVVDDDED